MSPKPDHQALADLQEFEFPSTFIGRMRGWVHALAGKWALRYLVQQQNVINRSQENTMNLFQESMRVIDEDGVVTRKQVAELTAVVAQLQKRVSDLESKQDQQG